jgi:hypothetical protein
MPWRKLATETTRAKRKKAEVHVLFVGSYASCGRRPASCCCSLCLDRYLTGRRRSGFHRHRRVAVFARPESSDCA